MSRDNVWNIYSKISKINFHDFSKNSDSIFAILEESEILCRARRIDTGEGG